MESVPFVAFLEFLLFISAPTLEPCPSFYLGSFLVRLIVTSADLTLWPWSRTSCSLLLLVTSAKRGGQEGNGVSQTSGKE